MAGTLRDLKVWAEAVALAGEVVRTVRQHSRRETKVLTEHIMMTAASAAAMIAEGYGHTSPVDQRTRLQEARRELLRLETVLAIGKHADLIPAAELASLTQRIHSVSRLVGGFLVYLERQVATDEAELRPAPAGAN
jgi:four helix bundle protein